MFALKGARRKGFLVFVVLLLLSLVGQVQANPRHAAIVIDADTGQVLHESNADASRYPASLTKMMTLYMLFEAMERGKMNLDTPMQISTHAASMPQTNIRLRSGDTLNVRDAIPALIVRSANDVAAVVAEALGGTEANFGRMMTEKARKLGMYSTTFRNASGLPHSEQRTTARDMATLSTRLMKDFPQYYHYFSTQSFRYKGITYNSHNRMVRNTPGVDGLKTGFIRASGFNVATSAKRGNRRIVAVVMGGQSAASRDRQMAQLLDRSFTQSVATKSARNVSNIDAAPAVAMKASTSAPVSKLAPLQPKTPELATKSARNVSNIDTASAVAMKASMSAPVSKPVPLQPKIPELAMMKRPTSSEVNVAPQRVAVVDSNSWAIQIGSYQAYDRAQAQAQAATRWVPGEIVVTEIEISNRKFYRAQLVGLQKNEAHTACQSLARQGIECLVVRSHS
ncbi:D-alanyl-D-alanine carboxypeptidase family protein [Nitrosomonas sp. Is37]|uniref:D-alanyl-D-alanine carboxypeptidase family protein n=1 Tax=Nitrosomonas sp. Is37 TaxID=3080535 RepID=UPI00294B97F2|nr:D-alanyl-D-alanine carboxypeptidase family protein [Nitrosomonas sp. Is37]MDV6343788.1 D-alanyl-D-alanine carboxypeptidase family protein [Nitrosomonas sp. Is37]